MHGETRETVRNFILGGSKITADGDCSHEMKRLLLLGREIMTNLDSILRSKYFTLPTKFHIAFGCESWIIKMALKGEVVLSTPHVWI